MASTVGLNNLVKGILFFSSLGLFTNSAAGSRPHSFLCEHTFSFPLSPLSFSLALPPPSCDLVIPLLFSFPSSLFFFQSLFHLLCCPGVQMGEVSHIFRSVAPSISVFRTPPSSFCPSSSWSHSVLLSSTPTGGISGCALQ